MKIARLLLGGLATACVMLGQALACGQERWSVKVLGDHDASQIHKTAETETVAHLGSKDFANPTNLDRHHHKDTRIGPQELTTYKVRGLLKGFLKEGDEDYHIVITDEQDHQKTMIVEIPAADCVSDAKLKKHVEQFRTRFAKKYGEPPTTIKWMPTPLKPIVFRGIGFFDVKHGTPQHGVAPNGMELHPVIGMSLNPH